MRVSTPDPGRVQAFVALLEREARGRAHALTARQLSVLGFGDRELRALASTANARGALVCADGRGYFVPGTADEATEMVARLEGQARHMQARARVVRRLVGRMFAVSHAARPLLDLVDRLDGALTERGPSDGLADA